MQRRTLPGLEYDEATDRYYAAGTRRAAAQDPVAGAEAAMRALCGRTLHAHLPGDAVDAGVVFEPADVRGGWPAVRVARCAQPALATDAALGAWVSLLGGDMLPIVVRGQGGRMVMPRDAGPLAEAPVMLLAATSALAVVARAGQALAVDLDTGASWQLPAARWAALLPREGASEAACTVATLRSDGRELRLLTLESWRPARLQAVAHVARARAVGSSVAALGSRAWLVSTGTPIVRVFDADSHRPCATLDLSTCVPPCGASAESYGGSDDTTAWTRTLAGALAMHDIRWPRAPAIVIAAPAPALGVHRAVYAPPGAPGCTAVVSGLRGGRSLFVWDVRASGRPAACVMLPDVLRDVSRDVHGGVLVRVFPEAPAA